MNRFSILREGRRAHRPDIRRPDATNEMRHGDGRVGRRGRSESETRHGRVLLGGVFGFGQGGMATVLPGSVLMTTVALTCWTLSGGEP
ncbi:hypothetical protein E0504_34420 [Parafrankia sp. BMG5.11]|nr:hypothetical protein E0504_34420 [Parafrankia sp. BMG5.11]